MAFSLFESLWVRPPPPSSEPLPPQKRTPSKPTAPPTCRGDGVEAEHFYTELKKQFPHMTDTELLNANNKKELPPTRDIHADVVVVGGGIVGLMYAIQLKTVSPTKQIVVLEKNKTPTYKIGESTLSSFTRWTNTYLLDSAYLLRLFGVKEGLSFYGVDATGERVTSVDHGHVKVSFQLDRRVSDLLLTLWAQRLGVHVYYGVSLLDVITPDHRAIDKKERMKRTPSAQENEEEADEDVETDPVKRFSSSVTWQHGADGGDRRLSTSLVCDASGFARKVAGDFGARESFAGWNTNAYWAYFTAKKSPGPIHANLHNWDRPAGNHVCFPDGWAWFLRVLSWRDAPLPNLMDMLLHVIELGLRRVGLAELPSASELSAAFDCPNEFVHSIGFAVRDDARVELAPGERATGGNMFRYFQRKYPVVDDVLRNRYELLERYYENRTFFTLKQMSFKSPVVAGRGWLAIGNAVGFTNPLFSPGINAGVGTAIAAVELTLALHRTVRTTCPTKVDAVVAAKTRQYAEYIQQFMLPRLDLYNRFNYNGFRDPRVFVECAKVVFAHAVDASLATYHSTAADKFWLVGAGKESFREAAEAVLQYTEGKPHEPMTEPQVAAAVAFMRELVRKQLAASPPIAWSAFCRHTDDQLIDVPGKNARTPGAPINFVPCAVCGNWNDAETPKCAICGAA